MPTKIPWTNETWNPFVGCSKVSAGCLNCYAERMAASGRLQQFEQYRKVITNGKWYGTTALVPHILEQPLHWRKPRMIFVSSMGDLFHESVPFEWIDEVMAVIALCPQHTFQILTKRPGRMSDYFQECNHLGCGLGDRISNGIALHANVPPTDIRKNWPLKHLWLGVTCENQKWLDRYYDIEGIQASKLFVSFEPLLSNIETHFDTTLLRKPDWAIIGCESGPGRRPCKLEWVRNIVAQCRAAGVAVFVKQLSISNKVIHDIEQFPEDLRIQEYPEVQSD